MVYPSWEYTVQRCLCQVRMYAPAYSCCALIVSTCNFFDFTTTVCCCCFCCWNFKLLESSIVFACHKLLHLTPANCSSKNCRFWKIQWQHEANHAYAYLFATFIHGILKRYNYVQFVQGRFRACKATKCWYSKGTLPHWKYKRQKCTFNNVEIDIDSLIISNLLKYSEEIWCYFGKKGECLCMSSTFSI